jgi:hypothetical protein
MGLLSGLFGGDTPQNKGLNKAAEANAKLSKEAFDWFKQEYVRTTPQREAAEAVADQSAKANLDAQVKQNQIADEYNTYNKETYRPLEKRLVADAQSYDTPARQQQEADKAVADVNAQASSQREAAARDLASYGIAPDSGKSMSLLQSGDINTSRLAAAAATGARDRVQATGYARMADAANLGRNLPSSQATAVQTGIQAGNSAVGNQSAGLAATNSGAALMGQGFNTAIQGNQSAGNLYGQQLQADVTSRGQTLQFLGDLAGGAKSKSSPKIKKNRKVIDPEASMEALRGVPMESWEYDPKKGGPDDGGKPHQGPMADKVQKKMGDDVAPDGKLLDIASMLSVVANSVKNIDKRMSILENRKAA